MSNRNPRPAQVNAPGGAKPQSRDWDQVFKDMDVRFQEAADADNRLEQKYGSGDKDFEPSPNEAEFFMLHHEGEFARTLLSREQAIALTEFVERVTGTRPTVRMVRLAFHFEFDCDIADGQIDDDCYGARAIELEMEAAS